MSWDKLPTFSNYYEPDERDKELEKLRAAIELAEKAVGK